MYPPTNKEFAWGVEKVECFWYWFNDQGVPYGPYNTEEEAYGALSDYDMTYYD